MQSPVKWLFSIVLCISTQHSIIANCAPAEYDLDNEQAEARYDPRLLSQELLGSHSPPKQGAEDCVSSNRRYEHGEKISRRDPCEVCICVDGEIFCWWKQCPTEITTIEPTTRNRPPPTKKPRKNPKVPPKKATNYPKKKILTFPQNLPVHLSELELLNESDGTNITYAPPPKILTTPYPITTTVFTTQSATELSDNITHSESLNQAQEASTEAFVDTTAPRENVYFEKTIVNRNGVFIENIRKITEVVNRTLAPEPPTEEDEEHGARKISIEDDALSKHYIITSSGRIENNPDSVLASESVVAQFRNSFDSQNTTTLPLRVSTSPTTSEDIATISTTTIESFTQAPDVSTTVSESTTLQSTMQTSTEAPPKLKCIVMGQSYEVGTVLPQETGNCLQCICIAGATAQDAPKVTCSPHNCPPLILPDLFDTTGY
ncbi:mucin-2 [Phlebotomus papatasi]|uniref:mucin-2 n=1 Tax=Phlebotomus papatasi TaxID=29031 RepID=UPI002483B1C2|nr:mucin-2 [Phlebotomus papatasi]